MPKYKKSPKRKSKSPKRKSKSPKHRKLTYEEMGYIKVLDKSRWVLESNKGIRCATCVFLSGPSEGKKLWHCELMDKDNLVHEQGCCNNYNHDDKTIDNKFLSGKQEIKILGKNNLTDIEDLV